MDEAQQKLGRIHGRETARQKEEGRQKIQGRARRKGGRGKTAGKKDQEKKVKKSLGVEPQASGVSII